MTTALVFKQFIAWFGAALNAVAARSGMSVAFMTLPEEPLPAHSPLWDLPNVIISPHNASASTGNEKRCAEMFIANFGHRARGEPMFNVQRVS